MARPRKSDEDKLNHPVSFRLTDGDFLHYKKKFAQSGLTQSEFFRAHVLSNTTRVLARRVATADSKRAVLLLQKSSNNINQLAHRANAEHLAGQLSEVTFVAILARLERLRLLLLDRVNMTMP